jgi:hypothetical protein
MAKEALFLLQVGLVLHHRVRGLDVVGHQAEKAHEVLLQLQAVGRLGGKGGVLGRFLQEREHPVHMREAAFRFQFLNGQIQQIHGAFKIDVAPGEVDGPVQMEIIGFHVCGNHPIPQRGGLGNGPGRRRPALALHFDG